MGFRFMSFFILDLFIYWLCWVFIATCQLSSVRQARATIHSHARFLIAEASLAAAHGL